MPETGRCFHLCHSARRSGALLTCRSCRSGLQDRQTGTGSMTWERWPLFDFFVQQDGGWGVLVLLFFLVGAGPRRRPKGRSGRPLWTAQVTSLRLPLKTRANRLQFHWPKCTPNTREPGVSLPSIVRSRCDSGYKGDKQAALVYPHLSNYDDLMFNK